MTSLQDESDFTLLQQVLITLIPAITGTLSILGSSAIVFMLFQDWSEKTKRIKYRLLLTLCIVDILNSLFLIFWSLPIPRNTPGVWGAIGNKQTCDFQGFLFQVSSLQGPFYNAALSHYFCMSVYYGMSEEEIARRYERWIHGAALVWPIGTAIAALILDLYSFCAIGCWIAPEPLRCHRGDTVECVRGENAYIYVWVFTGVPQVIISILISWHMYRIYNKIKQVSLRAEAHSFRRQITRHTSELSTTDNESHMFSLATSEETDEKESKYAARTREAGWQSFLYVAAYMVTHVWGFIVVDVELAGGTNPFYLILLNNFFWPLQGFFNAFVFLRPRIRGARKQEPSLSYWRAAYLSTFHFDDCRGQVDRTILRTMRLRKSHTAADSGSLRVQQAPSRAAGNCDGAMVRSQDPVPGRDNDKKKRWQEMDGRALIEKAVVKEDMGGNDKEIEHSANLAVILCA